MPLSGDPLGVNCDPLTDHDPLIVERTVRLAVTVTSERLTMNLGFSTVALNMISF